MSILNISDSQPQTAAMAFRTASLSLRRMISTSAVRSDMTVTFGGPNAVFYNKATNIKQVCSVGLLCGVNLFDELSFLQIDVPSFSGAFGILPNHVPTLAVLKPGVVSVYEEEGAVKKFFVSSGSVSINEDASVQILAEEAHPVEDIDSAAARDIVAQAQAKVSSAADEVRCNYLFEMNRIFPCYHSHHSPLPSISVLSLSIPRTKTWF